MGGQAEAAEPVGQVVGVVDDIATLPGVNEQAAWLGRPEQESVTNMGEVSVALPTGVTVTVTVPVVPGVSVMGNVEGETGVRLNWKLGLALVVARVFTWVLSEADASCAESPA